MSDNVLRERYADLLPRFRYLVLPPVNPGQPRGEPDHDANLGVVT
ncbi:hypothetical protein [Amycolatopsis sp. FDAARGOS 1241]|nr:hypothetical protein [Amycolatopsis sp. FDAARGOS 1241]